MDTIRLTISVPDAIALREGTGRAGADVVPLSPEVLSALSSEDRALLARLYEPPRSDDRRTPPGGRLVQHVEGAGTALTLPSADTSPVAVVEALRVALAGYRASLDELARAIEANPSRHLYREEYGARAGDVTLGHQAARLRAAAPEHPVVKALLALAAEAQIALRDRIAAKAIERGASALVGSNGDVSSGLAWWGERPELVELLTEAKALSEQRRANTEAARIKEQANQERAAAEKAARREVVTASMRAYALKVDDLAPAAEDGYDVIPGVLEHIAEQVAAAARGIEGVVSVETITRGTRAWDEIEIEDRASPRAPAVKAQRALKASCAALTLPEGVSVEVEKVQRITRDGERSTGLVAQVLCEIGAARLVVGSLE